MSNDAKENGIEKSVGDSRSYDHFELANGLQVVTITDPEADKAVACMWAVSTIQQM